MPTVFNGHAVGRPGSLGGAAGGTVREWGDVSMHRFRAGAAVLALAAAAGGLAAADKKQPPAPARPPVVVEPLPPDVMAEAVRAEQDAYLRRLDVCTKLKQIAAEKGDDALAARAGELERQATALYEYRVAKLGLKPTKKPAEATLDAKLGTGAAVNPLKVAPPKPAGTSVAELREVTP